MFHLRLLQCAVALADHRHFRKAAEEVRITQSGFTQSIQRLEEHYGELLFVRDRQGVTPTEFGDIVINGARVILDRITAMEREIKLTSNIENGELVIGADPLLVNSILGPALANLLRNYPGLSVSVRSEIPEELDRLLEHRELDLFISYPVSKTNPAVELRTYTVPAPVVVCAPAHPLTKKKQPKLSEILEYPQIGGTLPEWFFNWISSQLGADRPELIERDLIKLQINDANLLKRITCESASIMALMRSEVQTEINRGELVELKVPKWPTTVPIVIGAPSASPLPVAAQRLLEEVERTIAALSEKAGSPPFLDSLG